jgi:O-antigen/teichoic acid export membrane protein
VSEIVQPVVEREPTASTSMSGKVASSAASEIFGFGASLAVRLAANLILTRLLFPEAFGLMAMVQVVLYGLAMLSDVGIWQSIVTSPRGDEPSFLDTAWTMLVVRGTVLWLGACVLTVPIMLAFDEPQLLWLLPLTCLSTAIHGFSSTRVFTLRRRLTLFPLQLLELGTQLTNVTVCVVGAWLGYGVGALVAGQLVSHAVNASTTSARPWPRCATRSRPA